MKRLTLFCLLLGGLAYSHPSQAQFFKKLKKTVSKTVKDVSADITGADTAYASPSGGFRTVNATHADLTSYFPDPLGSLQPGEKFDFNESCLSIHAGILSAQVVVARGSARFLIGKDGQRIPVKKTTIFGCPVLHDNDLGNIVDFDDIAYGAPNVDKKASENFSVLYVHSHSGISGTMSMQNNLSPQQMEKLEQMADKMEKEPESGGEIDTAEVLNAAMMFSRGTSVKNNMHYNKDSAGSYIVFNHKRYGPYASVQSMMINKAHTRFVALVLPGQPDMPQVPASSNPLIITSEGTKKKTNLLSASFLPFGDFNHYRLMVMDESMHSSIYYPESGKEIPIIGLNYVLKIDKSTGALVEIAENKVYINGRLATTIPDIESLNSENIYISGDQTKCAVWTVNGLYLPDGNKIDGVVSCNKQVKNGKTILSWIVLGSDNKTLYLCHTGL